MSVKFTLVSFTFVALFGSSISQAIPRAISRAIPKAIPQAPTQEISLRETSKDDINAVIKDVSATLSEIYKIFILTSEIVFLIPAKGALLVGSDAVALMSKLDNAFNDISTGVRDITEVTERHGFAGMLYKGTEIVLFIFKTIRKTLEMVKKYMESV